LPTTWNGSPYNYKFEKFGSGQAERKTPPSESDTIMSDEESGQVEMQTPVVRRGRGGRKNLDDRLKNARSERSKSPGNRRRDNSSRERGRRGRQSQRDDDNEEDDDGDGDEDDDEVTPLNRKNDSEREDKGGKPKLSTQNTKSKLWDEDDDAVKKIMRKRYVDLMPFVKPIKTQTYTLSQNAMRFVSMLMFAHAVCAFQVLCVVEGQCFDTYQNPAIEPNENYKLWTQGMVFAMIFVSCVMVPLNLHLLRTEDLTTLKIGSFLQILFCIIFSALGGTQYGDADSPRGFNGMLQNYYKAGAKYYSEPTEEQRFTEKSILYYGLGGVVIDGVEPTGTQINNAIGEEMTALKEQSGHYYNSMMWFLLTCAFMFLVNFSFHIAHLCNVYYDPKPTARNNNRAEEP